MTYYMPSQDSILLADAVRNYRGDSAIEIGIGSGIVSKALLENFKLVAATDINIQSLKKCRSLLPSEIHLVCCDAAFAFKGKFDLVVSNPPYLPSEGDTDDLSIFGGPSGVETTIKFIKSARELIDDREGIMLFVTSSLSNTSKIDYFLEKSNLEKKVVKSISLFFETLEVIEIRTRDFSV